jgi:hypothetical protein
LPPRAGWTDGAWGGVSRTRRALRAGVKGTLRVRK